MPGNMAPVAEPVIVTAATQGSDKDRIPEHDVRSQDGVRGNDDALPKSDILAQHRCRVDQGCEPPSLPQNHLGVLPALRRGSDGAKETIVFTRRVSLNGGENRDRIVESLQAPGSGIEEAFNAPVLAGRDGVLHKAVNFPRTLACANDNDVFRRVL